MEVMELVSATPRRTDPQLCAAVMHDVVEDTKVTLAMIQTYFGALTARLVGEVTNVAPRQGTREERFAINLRHLAAASPAAKTIKLADVISNCKDIVLRAPPAFSELYLTEKQQVLAVLTEGDPGLYARAEQIINDGLQQLKGMK
jgi:(p)ppGpp synthase/HD superfamily hydrolase